MTDDLHQLAAAYALDALSDEERERFEAHLADCEECRGEVAGFQDTAALLGSGAAERAPERMRSRVLDAIDRTPQDRIRVDRPPHESGDEPPRESGHGPVQGPADGPAQGPADRLVQGPADGPARESGDGPVQGPASLDAARERRRRRGGFDFRNSGMAAAAAAVAVVAVVAAGTVVGQRLGDEPRGDGVPAWVEGAPTASLEAPEGVDARFAYRPDRDQGLLIVEGLEPVDPERNVYQLWLFHDDQPLPAGVFTTDEDGTAQVPAGARVAGAELVAVTVEPPGGSAQPTTEPILAGEL